MPGLPWSESRPEPSLIGRNSIRIETAPGRIGAREIPHRLRENPQSEVADFFIPGLSELPRPPIRPESRFYC